MHVNDGRGGEVGEEGVEREDSDNYDARYYTPGNACGTFAF